MYKDVVDYWRPKFNPHNSLARLVEPPGDWWECQYCGLTGMLAEVEAVECTYEYPVCKHCGQTPICAEDCIGIAAILSGGHEDVYVIAGGIVH